MIEGGKGKGISRRTLLLGLLVGAVDAAVLSTLTSCRQRNVQDGDSKMATLSGLIASAKSSIVAIGSVTSDAAAGQIVREGGTGFIVSQRGHILTAHHVFAAMPDAEKQNMVAWIATGPLTYAAFPIKHERSDEANDIALFSFRTAPSPLPPALPLGNSDSVRDGEDAMFIGFPQAIEFTKMNLGITLATTRCIVSAVKKAREAPTMTTLLLLDVHNNRGTSGAPLISLQTGQVVGVMAGNFGTPIGGVPGVREIWTLSYARPINFAKPLL